MARKPSMRTLAARASDAKELAIHGQDGRNQQTLSAPVARGPDKYEKVRRRADSVWQAQLKIYEFVPEGERQYLPVPVEQPRVTRRYQDDNLHAPAAATSSDGRGKRLEDLTKRAADLMDLGIDMS